MTAAAADIADNIKRLEDAVAAACAKARRDPAEVTVVAVSKQKSAADIRCAAAAGLQHFGENRVEEGMDKIPQVNAGSPLTWHMVGHIQSRKAKQVAALFDVVQSVDSLRLAQRLSRLAEEKGRALDVLLEVNVSGEASKYGFRADGWQRDAAAEARLRAAVQAVAELPHLRVRGLMTMAPFDPQAERVRRVFADLYALREALAGSLGISLPELSMGMTNDYPIAIEEGATMIRIGRAIFGERRT